MALLNYNNNIMHDHTIIKIMLIINNNVSKLAILHVQLTDDKAHQNVFCNS